MSSVNLAKVQHELEVLLKEQKYNAVRHLLLEQEAVDIADIAEELEPKNLAPLFRLLPKDLANEVFVYLSADSQHSLISSYTDAELGEVMEGLFNDDLIDILEELPAQVAKRMLKQSSPERRKQVNMLLQYPDDSAGSIMTTEYMRLQAGMTVAEALQKLRKIDQRVEMIYTCFVTNAERILLGVITVADILRAPDHKTIGEIMNNHPHFLYTGDDQEEAAKNFRDYDLLAMPVLDSEHRLVGIVTVDDIVDVMVQEANEDHSYMGGMQSTELPYPETTVWGNVKRRILWLMLLMLSGTFNALLLQRFEPVYVAIPALVAIMPRLTSAGGNAASQTSSVEIVALSTGQITKHDFLKVLWHEFRVALICASVLSVLNTGLTYFRYGQNIQLALTIGISFFLTIMLGKVLASILPYLATLLHLDPAMVVSPTITTIVDILALLIYYNTATALFGL